MLTFITHDQALMWSRFERMIVVMSAAIVVAAGEIIMIDKPTWIFTSLATLVAGFVILKCWADIALLSEPDKNCWAFKEWK